jgi:hypothetical protein
MTDMTMREHRKAKPSRIVSGRLISRVAAGTLALIGFGLVAGQAQAGCTDHIIAAEKEFNIPKGMLLAVSLVESGGGGSPSPYIMNVRGRAVFPGNESEAARYLRDSKGNLRDGVFAGCMQLSLAHHKQAFRPVEKIVNPEANVRYAAKYLVQLRQEVGSWAGAVARYNGSAGMKAASYQCKVQRQLVNLGAEQSASLIDARNCGDTETPAIAPRTRRAFEQHSNTPVG